MKMTEDDLFEIWEILVEESTNPTMRATSFVEFLEKYYNKNKFRTLLASEEIPF